MSLFHNKTFGIRFDNYVRKKIKNYEKNLLI